MPVSMYISSNFTVRDGKGKKVVVALFPPEYNPSETATDLH